MNKLRNERGNITTDATEIKQIMRDYCKKLYAGSLDNLEEMTQFLETYNPIKI